MLEILDPSSPSLRVRQVCLKTTTTTKAITKFLLTKLSSLQKRKLAKIWHTFFQCGYKCGCPSFWNFAQHSDVYTNGGRSETSTVEGQNKAPLTDKLFVRTICSLLNCIQSSVGLSDRIKKIILKQSWVPTFWKKDPKHIRD